MNLYRILSAADSRAHFTHEWRDFPPMGMLIARDGHVMAIGGLPATASLREVIITTGRAARRGFAGLQAIGLAVAAWASVSAVQEGVMPSLADDRQRSRIFFAADSDGQVHQFSNRAGQITYTVGPPNESGTIGELLAQAMAEATFTAQLLCSTGEHERTLLL